MKTKIELLDVVASMQRNNYQVFYELQKINIVGIRSVDKTVDIFNDIIFVFYRNQVSKELVSFSLPATTDPGLSSLKKLINPKGTAILVPGQYKYLLGTHRGKYTAFNQAEPVAVFRDKNKDNIHDFSNIDTGYFGINIHRAGSVIPKYVSGWSAGCQVVQKKDDFDKLIFLALAHKKLFGNLFYYTLLKEEDLGLFHTPKAPEFIII